MKKIISWTLLMGTIILLAGCLNQAPDKTSSSPNKEVSNKTYLTYLSSTEDPLEYCNGDKMDSDGYKKTITNKITSEIVIDEMTQSEIAKAIILAATSGMCQSALKETDIRVDNNTVYIGPIEGWAGISITMCSCRPEIEVNLLQLPGITKIIFEE